MFSLEKSNFNILFPFYVHFNKELKIISQGDSLTKMNGLLIGKSFAEVFTFIRPRLSITMEFDSIIKHLDTVIIVENTTSKVRHRGQFILNNAEIIFINSPWIVGVEDIENNNLQISDFALHDTVTDNIQVLRSKEIVNEDLMKVNSELTKQRDEVLEKNKIILDTEAKYKILVENSADIIYRVNSIGDYIYVNPTSEKITGYSESDLLGNHYSILLDEVHKTKLANFYYFQLTQNIESTYIEFPMIRKDGKRIWLGQSVNLIKLPDGEIEYIALARDITDRKLAEKALIKSEEKYRSILENLELGLVESNREGIIVKAYPKFCQLVGYTEDELIGKNGMNLLLDEENQNIMNEQNEKREKGKPSVYEVQLTKKNGEKIWVLISGAPFYNMNDELIGTFGVHVDITDRKKMEKALYKAKEIAENSVKSKDLFLANMSHEIRTPLNAIVGLTEIMMQSSLTQNQRKYLESISKSSDNLLVIINDILDFSKINAGKLELEYLPVNLDELIRNAYSLFKLKANEKENYLRITTEGISECGYICDPYRLSGVLNNLLSNAIKFTNHGDIHISCKRIHSEKEKDTIIFSVEDSGIGISPESQAKIFENFTQANESISRNFGGTGLGLTISKEIVNMLGGELKVTSEVNKGSTFFFTLTLEKTVLPKSKIYQDDNVILDFNEARILVADDNEMNLFLAKNLLDKWNCKVTTVLNGGEAVEALEQEEFDLVLMDIRMPVLDGVEATWMIRNKMKLSIPIIALTANIMENELKKYIEHGMNDYLCKPFKQAELYELLVRYLPNQSKQIMKEENKQDESISQTKTLVDLTRIKETFNNNEEFITKMIELFIDTTPESIGKLEQALPLKDEATIKGLAHKLKPSLDYLAIPEIAALARKLENEELKPADFQSGTEQFIQYLIDLIEELKTK